MALVKSQTNLMESVTKTETQFQTSNTISSNENQPKEIVAYFSVPKIVGQSQEGEMVSFNGETKVYVSFISQTNELVSQSFVVEWNSTCPSYNLSNIWLKTNIADSELSLTSGGFNYNSVITVEVSGVSSVNLEQVEENEEIVTKSEEQDVLNLTASTEDEAHVISSLKINRAVDQILHSTCQARITSAISDVNKVNLEGNCFVEILARSGETVFSQSFMVPFKQEAACIGAVPGAITSVKSYLKDFQLTLGEDGSENVSSIDVNATVACAIYLYSSQTVKLTKDAFSIATLTTPTFEAVNLNAPRNIVAETRLVSGVINIENYPEFDDVSSVTVSDARVALNGENQETGVISCVNVLLKNQDGELFSKCEQVVLNLSNMIINNQPEVLVRVESFHVRAGKELEVNFEALLVSEEIDNYCLTFVSNLDESEISESENAGIKMYCVKENESLFDVCRELRVRPEVVAMQNENTESLKAGDKVFVYVNAEAKFE